jgi:hypothetical protein
MKEAPAGGMARAYNSASGGGGRRGLFNSSLPHHQADTAPGGSGDLFVHAKHLFLEAIGDGWPWGRWLQWFQRMTMSEGTGPSNEERHCADADGDHRFSYDEGPQSRQKHEEAAHDEDCRLGREEMFRCWAHCSLQMDATPS